MWYVSQISRREHYALPVHLYRTGNLGLFATDIWAPWADKLPPLLRPAKFAQRYNPGLSGARVASPPLLKMMKARLGKACQYARWVDEGRLFGKFTERAFLKTGLKAGDTVIGYTAANLEQLILAKRLGAKALHIQVDPGMSWYETRRIEQLRHPEAEDLSPMPDAGFIDRIGSEWRTADKVIVHSGHSRAALLAQGVSPERCVVIPPAFQSSVTNPPRRADGTRPLRVLFVGNHCLAKGYHIFVEAARQAGKEFEFISIGGQTMKSGYLADSSRYVAMQGRLAQSDVHERMRRADVLVFPTLSDGFGLVQLEAMAAGLPVITTSKCGEVVRHGVDGFIIPTRDSSAILAVLSELRSDPDKYERLSTAASRRHLDFSVEHHFNAVLSL